MELLSNINAEVISVVLLTGVFPTILWLFFWLREDRFKPEPVGLLTFTFIAGALSVFLVLPLDEFVKNLGIDGTQRIFTFAFIEEVVKFGVVYLIVFHSSYLDEPIDYAIYLITGALGFAMMENVMFLLNPDIRADLPFIIETGMLRFLGASVLHAVLAATLGIILGFVFYKRPITRLRFFIGGILIVTILHTIFNYFIIKYVEIDGLLTLGILWVVAIGIIALFERVRKVNH
jgi:RsiW-degrading membrane proteinase PrsW (M82 family)